MAGGAVCKPEMRGARTAPPSGKNILFSPQKTQKADLTEAPSRLLQPNSLLETDPERAGARRFRSEGYGHGDKEEGDCKQSAGSDCQYLHSVSSFHNLTLASLPAVVMLVHTRLPRAVK